MSIKKNFLYNIILQITTVLFPLVTFPYVSRIIGPEGIGTINFALNFSGWFIILCSLGIPSYGIREIARLKNDYQKRSQTFLEIFFLNLISALLFSMIYFILIFSFSRFDDHKIIFILAGFTILMSAFSTEWFFSGMSEFKFITIRSLSVRIINILGLFIFVKKESDVLPYFLLSFFSQLFISLVNINYALKFINLEFNFRSLNIFRHLKKTTWIYLSYLSASIFNQFGPVILGYLTNDYSVGLYSIAIRVSRLPLVVSGAIISSISPSVYLYFSQRNIVDFKRVINSTLEILILIFVPVSIGFFLFSGDIVKIFAGSKFDEAILCLKILAFLPIICSLCSLVGGITATATNNEFFSLKAIFIGSSFTIIISFISVSSMKHNGIALACVIGELTTLGFYYFYSKRNFDYIHFTFSPFLKSILSSLPFIVVFYLFKNNQNLFLRVIFECVFCVVIYLFIQIFIFKNNPIINFYKQLYRKYFPKKNYDKS